MELYNGRWITERIRQYQMLKQETHDSMARQTSNRTHTITKYTGLAGIFNVFYLKSKKDNKKLK